MAFLHTSITGNTSFGGYISMDGDKSVPIQDDMTYEITPGKHNFRIFTKSDLERRYGNAQHGITSHISNPGLLDAIIDAHAAHSIGDGWSFDVILENNDCVTVAVTSKGQNLIGDPVYEVEELPADVAESLRSQIEQVRNTPRRSKKLMGWGIGLMAAFGIGTYNLFTSSESYAVATAVFFIAMIGVGALLFWLGFQKKKRS